MIHTWYVKVIRIEGKNKSEAWEEVTAHSFVVDERNNLIFYNPGDKSVADMYHGYNWTKLSDTRPEEYTSEV